MNMRTAATVLAGLALAACGGDFESIDRPGSGDTGKVRLVNATTANTTVDLYDSGTALQTGVPIFGASGYSSVSTGSRTLSVRSSGSTIATTPVNSVRDDHQAVVAYTSGTGSAATVLSETDASPAAGNAKLRILNTGAANVDVYVVTGTCAANATATSAAFATNLGSIATTYATVTASNMPYRVCITTAGNRGDVRTDASLALYDQRIVTVILTLDAANALKALSLDQQAAPALLASTP